AACKGPKARTPASARASTTPATSGASGPTTTRSTCSSTAVRTMPSTSSAPTSKHGTPSRAMPTLPGAAITSGRCGLRTRPRTSACSRPPPPTTRTLGTGSERGYELVDGDRGERLVARGAARAELHRHARHRLLVGRLHHVHDVEPAEGGPLSRHFGTQRLDLLVHLAYARGVVLDRLHALC